MRISFILSLVALPAVWAAAVPRRTSSPNGESDLSRLSYVPEDQKPRVFVCTDILNEPDDQESVVRYLLYSNEFNTRALCTTTSTWLRNSTHPEAVQHIVNAYGLVVNNLNQHVHPENQYASAANVSSLITSGPAVYGKAALDQPISEGASLLIERLQESEDPLWVLIWGGSNTLAQSLQHMQANLVESEFTTLRSRLRVYSISDQDDTGEWIRNSWPDIFWIASIHTFSNYGLATWQGMWTGLPDMVQKVSQPWIGQNIQIGPLGAVYPSRDVGAEGDTPSFLYLIQNGLGDRDYPGYGSWGGRYGPINIGGIRWADTLDTFYYPQEGKNETSNKATVARWRDHFQNDMATRMQWTLSPNFADGAHPPVPRINGTTGPAPIYLTVTPGSEIVLDASETYDPDHPADASQLDLEWFQYRDANIPTFPRPRQGAMLALEGLGYGASTPSLTEATDAGFRPFVRGHNVRISVPDVEGSYQYHLILQVTNNKSPQLPVRRYLRVVISTASNATLSGK